MLITRSLINSVLFRRKRVFADESLMTMYSFNQFQLCISIFLLITIISVFIMVIIAIII